MLEIPFLDLLACLGKAILQFSHLTLTLVLGRAKFLGQAIRRFELRGQCRQPFLPILFNVFETEFDLEQFLLQQLVLALQASQPQFVALEHPLHQIIDQFASDRLEVFGVLLGLRHDGVQVHGIALLAVSLQDHVKLPRRKLGVSDIDHRLLHHATRTGQVLFANGCFVWSGTSRSVVADL